MATTIQHATTEFEKKDRCSGLDHRPRTLLGKMGLDGHDRGVKVIARALRDSGAHVIYSGLWQTPMSLAISARDEDCDVIAASMMSNSHLALGPRLIDALKTVGRSDIPLHMGGILPQEDLLTLKEMGVAKCFTTGTGLLDIVAAAVESVRVWTPTVPSGHPTAQLARDISLLHASRPMRNGVKKRRPRRVIGVTGSPGAGKSTLIAQLVSEHCRRAKDDPSMGRVAVVAFDPMSPITGGALLGDRLRVDFNTLGESVFYRSLAISGEDYHSLDEIVQVIGGAELPGGSAPRADGASGSGPTSIGGPIETLFIETVGAGQNETKIRQHVDRTALALVPGMGDAVQMDKAGILEIADVFVCNKADHPGQNELMRDLREIAGRRPVVETVATRAQGIAELFDALMK